MSEDSVKNTTSPQIKCILDMIRETRVLIGSLESIEPIAEDKAVKFKPLFMVAKTFFDELLHSGQIGAEQAVKIKKDLDDLEEEVEEFDRTSSVMSGLCRLYA